MIVMQRTHTVVVQVGPAPPGQVIVSFWQPAGVDFCGQPQVQMSQRDLSAVRETTGLWASCGMATPTRVNGPTSLSPTEWITVERLPHTPRLQLFIISAEKRWNLPSSAFTTVPPQLQSHQGGRTGECQH